MLKELRTLEFQGTNIQQDFEKFPNRQNRQLSNMERWCNRVSIGLRIDN